MATPPTSRSLLERVRDPADAATWRRFHDLYAPLIRRWARPYVDQPADADDVAQEVLTTLVRELPRFEHSGRDGAFRAWLRAITVHRIRAHHDRARRGRGTGDPGLADRLKELEDPDAPLSRAWDEEHDRHVAAALLETIRLEFQPATWHAFDETVRRGRPAAEVADELGLSVNAVLIAKSRVLKKLRQRAEGLID